MACLLPTAEPSYPKPSISLSPSGGVSLRGAVSVWCRGQHQGMRFMLNKEGRHVRTVDSDGSEVVFYISNMSREDGGNYSCSYHSRSEPFAVSYPSDPMELVVTGEGRGPAHGGVSLGAVVTICCEGQHRGVRFVLNKEQRHYPPVDSDGFGAEFLISNVSREDSGNYSCSYHSKSEPFAVSYPSDPVELVVRGEGPGSASLGGVAQGEAVTIWCVCQCLGVRFLLRKGGAMAAHRTTAPAVDVVEFPICNVRRGDAGSYCCRYRTKWDPLISSEPSDPMELAGEGSGLASLLPAPRPSGPSGGLRASLGSCDIPRCYPAGDLLSHSSPQLWEPTPPCSAVRPQPRAGPARPCEWLPAPGVSTLGSRCLECATECHRPISPVPDTPGNLRPAVPSSAAGRCKRL
uniref:Immunoglobulin domain-containing protein n=1 Tax=Gopherus agassizii TaxID=38772 RepID=A0A452GN63_9SAUR